MSREDGNLFEKNMICLSGSTSEVICQILKIPFANFSNYSFEA